MKHEGKTRKEEERVENEKAAPFCKKKSAGALTYFKSRPSPSVTTHSIIFYVPLLFVVFILMNLMMRS